MAFDLADFSGDSVSRVSKGFSSSLLIPQDTIDEDVSLFDAEEDAGKRSKKTGVK